VSERIEFFGSAGPRGYLSNFSLHPITIAGEQWLTVEHYYQASKFDDEELRARIQRASSPCLAKALGWSPDTRSKLRLGWDDLRDDVMRSALRAKFDQHQELTDQLLATGNAELVERSDADPYWGDGEDGKGANKLGSILMDLREGLRSKSAVNPKAYGSVAS
jgi:ribA/ribD-fused uncharacterized protein